MFRLLGLDFATSRTVLTLGIYAASRATGHPLWFREGIKMTSGTRKPCGIRTTGLFIEYEWERSILRATDLLSIDIHNDRSDDYNALDDFLIISINAKKCETRKHQSQDDGSDHSSKNPPTSA